MKVRIVLVMMSAVEEAISQATVKLGYEQLKPEQAAVVKTFVGGKDVFAALPTGYGKSTCFAGRCAFGQVCERGWLRRHRHSQPPLLESAFPKQSRPHYRKQPSSWSLGHHAKT